MNDYDALNAYLHMLQANYFSFFNQMFQDHRCFVFMQEWLVRNSISIPFINNMTLNQYEQCKNATTIVDLSIFTNSDCKKELEVVRNQEQHKYHVLFLHGIENTSSFNRRFIDEVFLSRFTRNNCRLYHSSYMYGKGDLSFREPHDAFLSALYQIDRWPGIVVIKNGEYRFIQTNTIEDVEDVFIQIDNESVFQKKDEDGDMYIVHLSDLHLGPKKKIIQRDVLENSLDLLYQQIPSNRRIQYIITGDLMNSPNRKSMYAASSFINLLKRKYHGDVSFVLGNHDVIVKGFNIKKIARAKVIAYLLGGNVRIKEDERLIFIELNSTVEGYLARGKVGQEQLEQIDAELSKIPNLEEYTIIALLHHHVIPIPKDKFLKRKWYENMFIGRWIDNGKTLQDADEIIEWLKKRKITYVLHGHKHLPFFNYTDGVYTIACGSSCGGGASERKSRYLSYNVLKYDVLSQHMKYCIIYYEDTTHIGRKRVKVHLFHGGNYEVSQNMEGL